MKKVTSTKVCSTFNCDLTRPLRKLGHEWKMTSKTIIKFSWHPNIRDENYIKSDDESIVVSGWDIIMLTIFEKGEMMLRTTSQSKKPSKHKYIFIVALFINISTNRNMISFDK